MNYELVVDALARYDWVVSSEISGRKFPEIYSTLAENFQKFVNYLCQSTVSISSIANCKVML